MTRRRQDEKWMDADKTIHVRALIEELDDVAGGIDEREALMKEQFDALDGESRRIYIREIAAEALEQYENLTFILSNLSTLIYGSPEDHDIDIGCRHLGSTLQSLSITGGRRKPVLIIVPKR